MSDGLRIVNALSAGFGVGMGGYGIHLGNIEMAWTSIGCAVAVALLAIIPFGTAHD